MSLKQGQARADKAMWPSFFSGEELPGPRLNSLPLDLSRSAGSSLDLELRGCRDTSGAVSGQDRQRVVGNEVSHSWYVSRTAVGPAAGSLKVV